jgi:membrane protein
MRLRVPPLVKEVAREASADGLGRQAAALAYFAIFSLPGLLVLVVSVAALAWDRTAVERSLFAQFDGLLGRSGAEAIRGMLSEAAQPRGSSLVARVVGIGGLVLGATGFFLQLQAALDAVWGVRRGAKGRGIVFLVVKRLLSFGMVLGLGLLVVVSLAFHALLAAVGDRLAGTVVSGATSVLLGALELAASTVLLAGLFAAVYKFLPDLRIEWREVAVGALVTAVLFVLGKFAIGFYLGRSDPGSAYGAAGPLVLVLVWVYYSSLVVLVGAEFTQVYARRHGPHRAERARRAAGKVRERERPARAGASGEGRRAGTAS